jgi:hypothetical protein
MRGWTKPVYFTSSPWDKNGGKCRLTEDMRNVNTTIQRVAYAVPKMGEILLKLSGSNTLTSLILKVCSGGHDGEDRGS